MKARVKVVRALFEYKAGYDMVGVKEVGVARAIVSSNDFDIPFFEAIGNKIVELSEKVDTIYPALIFIEFDIDPEYNDYIEEIWNVMSYNYNVSLNEDEEAGWRADIIPTLAIDNTANAKTPNTIKTDFVEAARKVLD